MAYVATKTILKYLMDGTLEENLCRVCLKPFGDVCENIFTEFRYNNEDFSVAEILKRMCLTEFSAKDNCNVCADCIVEAFSAYSFYLKFRSSTKLLESCVQEINEHIDTIESLQEIGSDQIYIKLNNQILNYVDLQQYDVRNFLNKTFEICPEDLDNTPFIKRESVSPDNDLLEELPSNGPAKKARVRTRNKPEQTAKRYVKKRSKTHSTIKKCNLCSKEFKRLPNLFLHMKEVHSLTYCKICNDYSDSTIEDFKLHQRMHTKRYRCDVCNLLMCRRYYVIEHIQNHAVKLICDQCGFVAKSRKHLNDHYFRNHKDRRKSCRYCGKIFLNRAHFEQHQHKHEMIIKNKAIDEKPVLDNSTKKSRLICSHCGADYVNKPALATHVRRSHTGETPFPCSECDRKFVSKNLLREHVMRRHQRPTKRCPFCHNAFPTVARVNIHIRKVHLRKEKAYSREYKQNVTWPVEVVTFGQLNVKVQHAILDKHRSGDLVVPEEMMTEHFKRLLVKSEI